MQLKSLIAVPLVVLALAGCSSQAQNLQPSETSVVQKPLFASDEEALAAAQTAYAHYLEVSDQIARDGGANPERLKGLVTEEMFETEKATLDSFSEKKIVMEGVTVFDNAHLQSATSESVSMYLCLDTSGASLSGKEDSTSTPGSRRWPLLVVFERDERGQLLLSESQTWTGTNYC